MSTKIDSSPSLPLKLPSMDKLASAKLAKAAYDSKPTGASSPSSRGDDTVQITGDAMKMQNLEKSLASSRSFDAERVAAVRQAMADGSYKIDPERIASRLMASDAQLG
ncbi:MAG: Anti-sigma-28 factor FlgM family protein [Hydrocarboniphaga sp.]|uniref:flagellar biosynthesis anti-sigma factor FlgM n=1 Tax=Hydrocarboniphaga sp. TaxID=2033016 RepID=UPI0026307341|nr:flagellar biosynthesis anti-sigma factor FlgM [Hydrocarboniphaga sp.]MDB5967600.1 Anti-sigma-28 factor FlgM family protein [Hydrocarboniphaga sp.]